MNTLAQQIKEKIGDALVEEINSWDLTQKDAAIKLAITQPRISNLLKRKYQEFSLEFLLTLMEKTDLSLSVSVLK